MNRWVKVLAVSLIVVFCFGLAGQVSSAEAALKALIVDGQNNHDWESTTPVMKKILEQTRLFEVDVATAPGKGQPLDGFKPDFAKYDVVVSNYNGAEWPKKTREAFVDYVRSGGGVVIVHAADNSFPKWKEYNEIIGLGGWGDRDERWGPCVYWKDGKVVRDTSPGRGGTHGNQHVFQVINRNREHPITKGLPEKWMHGKEELYSLLRGPAENLTVLATAYDDPKQRGNGRHEPVLFTVGYGRGRVFQTVLGHNTHAMSCVGFIVTLQRGAEWAATGKVTQKVPKDFPTATEVRVWKDHKPARQLDELLGEIATYEYGQSREALSELTDLVRSACDSPTGLKRIEGSLLEFLRSDATPAGRQFVCRELSVIGTEEAVPTLAAMLTEKATSDIEPADMARYALEQIPGAAVDKALRDALGKTSGKVKVGIINSLGNRGDKKAVKQLSRLLSDSDSEIARAAISALGKIGGKGAAEMLSKAGSKVGAELYLVWADAYLMCADKFLAEGDTKAATRIYRQLHVRGQRAAVRSAALRGIVTAKPERGVRIVVDALKGDDKAVQAVAVGLLREIPGTEMTKAVTAELANLSVAGQVQVLSALADRGDRLALPAVIESTKSREVDVRIAAFGALAALGDASSVNLLAEAAATSKGTERQAARDSLYRLRGPGVDEKILDGIAKADSKVKVELIRGIGERNAVGGVKPLLKLAGEAKSKEARLESLKALKVIAGPEDLPALVGLVIYAAGKAELGEAENTLAAVARKISDENRRAARILTIYPTVKGARSRCSLLKVLGKIGDDSAVATVRAAAGDSHATVKHAGIRVLSEWPSDAPMDDLLQIASSSTDAKHRALALRGFLRMVGLDRDRAADETVKMYDQAMELASTVSEKKMVLSGLANVKSFAALQMAAGYLKDSSLRQEAEAAVVRIAESTQGDYPLQTRAVLTSLLEVSQNEAVRERARKVIERIDKRQGRSEREVEAPDSALDLIGADFSAWRKKTGTWQIVGEAIRSPENEKLLATQAGNGVIINGPKGRTVNIFSRAEFGDVKAHIEFVVPRGSNSGVYFMGRYEIQILDSWGVVQPKHSDCGGIYQRWDEKRSPKGYEGRPPRVNASLAPGQWQSYDVIFRAPRFDRRGKKIVNARFEKVIHNGIVIHEDAEVTGPTRASAYKDEKRTGPLMLQGDHGPVAYRNIWIFPLANRQP